MTWGKLDDVNWAREARYIQELYDGKKEEGLTVFAVVMDCTDEEAIKAFKEENRIAYPVTQEVESKMEDYRVTKSNTIMLADKYDEVIFNSVGLTDDEKRELEARIEEAL